ncbi:MAG: LamG domain-containing protein, partial [Planctomycetes bacterium]|nr:LamG domain-containing protein [Planctomycetota bacterium]
MKLKGLGTLFSIIFGSCFMFSAAAEEGIVGCWNFEEGQGDTVKDSSGNKNDGKIHGASWAKEDITDAMKVQGGTWAGDEFISVLRFNGTNNYVDCGNDKSLMPGNAMTVEAWLKMPNKGGCILNKRADRDGYILETNAGKISFAINPWAGSLRGNTDIVTGNWSHVAGTYDGNSVKVYVNGELDGSLEYKSPINPNAGNLIIGYRGSAPDSDYFNGIIGGVKIYNRALSAEEISRHFSEDPRSKKAKVAEKITPEKRILKATAGFRTQIRILI